MHLWGLLVAPLYASRRKIPGYRQFGIGGASMESDVDEKIFPEGASELRRTGSIIERRARRNLRAARQFSLPQTSDMRFSSRERMFQ